MTTCLHPQCDERSTQHQIDACSTHWYELPTPLRNRIFKHYAADNHIDYAAAVVDALTAWATPLRRVLHCDKCGSATDLIDNHTNRAICLVCAKAALGTLTPPTDFRCSRCRRSTPALVGIDRDPDLCLDCQQLELARTA